MSARTQRRKRQRKEDIEIANAIGVHGKRAAEFGRRMRAQGATIEDARRTTKAATEGKVQQLIDEVSKPPEPTWAFWWRAVVIVLSFFGLLAGLAWWGMTR